MTKKLRRIPYGTMKAVTAKPDWGNVPLDAVVVEVCSDCGYNWIPVTA